jgi:hypothetical protein
MNGSRIAALLFLIVLAGPVAAADVFRVEESAKNLENLHASNSTIEVFERSAGNPALRWKFEPDRAIAVLSIRGLPRDLTPYRTLRFKVRSTPAIAQSSYLRFVCEDGVLSGYLPGIPDRWESFEINLPDLKSGGGLETMGVAWMQISVIRPQAGAIEFDDIELVKGGNGWRYSEEEAAARIADPRYLVEDFEAADSMARSQAEQSTAARIATKKPKGHALRWTQAPAADGGWLDFVRVPDDIAPYRVLRFRARLSSGVADDVYVRFRGTGILEATFPIVGDEWETVEILLPEMHADGEFDPADIDFLRFVCFETKGHQLEIDDIELLKEGAGWRYSAEERRELGIDPTAPTFRLADFERRNPLAHLAVRNSHIETVELKKRGKVKGRHLRWTVKKESDWPGVAFLSVPRDLREYRTLRMRVRINKMPPDGFTICFQCMKGILRKEIPAIPKRWQVLEIPLPEMVADEDFDPKNVRVCRLVYYGEEAFVMEMDDLELVKGAGGWKMSEAEQVGFVFGKDRARKVRQIETDHFLVWTDSAAARKKFPKALEKTHDFVLKELGLPEMGIEEMPGQLPVYIFQSSNLYFDFCVRKGWSKAAAEATAGHAAGSYFATYYQAPGSATVTHELTHSIVHRTLGEGGGSWYQEGIAVHVEMKWQRKSAAADFAPRIRSGAYVPLAEFMKIGQLIGEDDGKGGPKTSHWLYAQAGAFFEFLLRGPYAETSPDRVRAISVLDTSTVDVVKEVEKILGRSIDEIEEDWKAWGRQPPKAGRKK